MGCVHGTLGSVDHAHQARRQPYASNVLQKSVFATAHPCTNSRSARDEVLSPAQTLKLSRTVASSFFPRLDHVTLTSIALIESSGCVTKKRDRASVGEKAIGVCQVLLSTSRWLAEQKGCDKYGVPCEADLLDAEKNLYYCASYLRILQHHLGRPQSEEFVVKAYHAGPKDIDTFAAQQYWRKFQKAKRLLALLQDALDAVELQEAGSGHIMHVVQPGESLPRIAAVCSVSVDDIMRANSDLQQPSDVRAFDCIALPVSRLVPRLHVVQPGDTLSGIAVAYRTTGAQILEQNPEMTYTGKLQPGWVVALPGLMDGSEGTEGARARRWQLGTTHQPPPLPAPEERHSRPAAAPTPNPLMFMPMF